MYKSANIKISIIIPIYNCQSCLRRCLESIVQQTYANIQIILIDDGSSDKSGEICDEAAHTDSRILVIHKKNAGVSAARNTGLEHAVGEYIMFCDSDDYPEPQWCEKMLELAILFPNHLPLSNYFRESLGTSSTNFSEKCNKINRTLPPSELFALYELELINIPWNKIYRRDIIQNASLRFNEALSLGEDLLFVLDYLIHVNEGFVFSQLPLYHYSIGNPTSLSAKYHPNLMQTYRVIFARLMEHMHSTPNAWEKYAGNYWYSYFWAIDRVFSNTFSPPNTASYWKKIKYNAEIFHSTCFAQAKSHIRRGNINILQYWGLKSNSYIMYSISKIFSEMCSKIIHGK